MLDINAPIIPARSAGGFQIGSRLPPELASTYFSIERYQHSKSVRYKSKQIDLWINDSGIWQIMVHDGYHGKVNDVIGIGSALEDVQTHLGLIYLDEVFKVIDIPGICFEIETDEWHMQSRIAEIYVFDPTYDS